MNDYMIMMSTSNAPDQLEEMKKLRDALIDSEEKLENSRLKTEFFGTISHEFKTPLNLIMGSIQIIELYTSNGAILDPEKKLDKYIKTMKQNAYRLLRLINNIIDLSKIDSDFMEMDLHNYNLTDIINEIVNSIKIYAASKAVNVSFVCELDNKIIACDADKIERILLNLLSNALKFTNENGSIVVELWAENGSVFISVEDDGIGIQKDKLDIIFQRFRMVDKSFTRNREGSGIGLSIVKALVEMHGGNIEVDSVYKKGTKFTIKLPDTVIDEIIQESILSQHADGRNQRIKIELSDI